MCVWELGMRRRGGKMNEDRRGSVYRTSIIKLAFKGIMVMESI